MKADATEPQGRERAKLPLRSLVHVPRQRRSAKRVHQILDAAMEVLIAGGADGFTTNRVAEQAGIPVGSIYQYFPNKEALVGELIDRHQDEMILLFMTRLTELRDAPLGEAVRGVISALMEAHCVDPLDAPIHKVLFRELPPVGLAERMDRLEQTAIVAVQTYLQAKSAHVRPDDKRLAAFLIVHVVQAAVLAVVVKES